MNDEATIPYREGWHAHRLGVSSPEKNPYHERKQSVSHSLWQSGWCERFGAVKHDRQDLLIARDQS